MIRITPQLTKLYEALSSNGFIPFVQFREAVRNTPVEDFPPLTGQPDLCGEGICDDIEKELDYLEDHLTADMWAKAVGTKFQT